MFFIGKGGYWEGRVGGREGWFPCAAIKELTNNVPVPVPNVEPDSVPIRTQSVSTATPTAAAQSKLPVKHTQSGRYGRTFALTTVAWLFVWYVGVQEQYPLL